MTEYGASRDPLGLVGFSVPGVVRGFAGSARLCFPDRGFPDWDLVLFLNHDNGDGTTQETLFWSRSVGAWSGQDGLGAVDGWGSLRDALWRRESCGRMWIDDQGVAAMEAFFAPDPWSWYLVASVMSS